MRLTFDYEYEDYSDEQNWPPRLQELQAFINGLDGQNVQSMEDAVLLDAMEEVEELMRFYTATLDFKHLESVMRKQMELLQVGRERALQYVGYFYLEMEFLRANALLYRNEDRNRQAADYYDQASQKAAKCFTDLKQNAGLTDKQKLFIGWACAEIWSETAQIYDQLMNPAQFLNYCNRTIEVLEWLEPYTQDAAGIVDKTADLYCTYGGMFYQGGIAERGRLCYEASVRMFRQLDQKYDSDFWYARSVWVKGLYGLQEFLCTGDPKIMLECEQEAEGALRVRFEHPRDKAIASATQGLILVQKGAVYQQNGNIAEAIACTSKACELLSSSLKCLEEDQKDQGTYYVSVIASIAARVFNCYVGALDTLGGQQYGNEQVKEAKASFETALSLLTNQSEYRASENASALLRAECLQYMALISAEENNVDEAEFYGTQAVALADSAAQQTENAVALAITITSSSIVAELYLALKQKPKAAEYAEKGLDACARLMRISPQSPQLSMQGALEKLKKKASRRFF